MRVRRYGSAGPVVLVLHGGPAAAGEAAPLARGLATRFQVLEPWQRGSGGAPLTVARHVADLAALIAALDAAPPPALVGESWGAMLALACAAAHPESCAALVLVCCGTFDPDSRAAIPARLAARIDRQTRCELERLAGLELDPEERLRRRYALLEPLYHVDPLPVEQDPQAPPFDVRAHRETWADMLREQARGTYPAAFAAIRVPVLMLHGAQDPHPGREIHALLRRYMPQIEYREWARCGHQPWRERHAREEFFEQMNAWLHLQLRPKARNG